MTLSTEPWQPSEDSSKLSLSRFRNALLPPSLAKRHFFLPRLNLIGITVPEILISVALAGGLVGLGLGQRTTEAEASGNISAILWLPFLLFITYRSPMAFFFGISFERSMYWHAYLAFLATAYGTWHGVASMYWAELDDDDGGGNVVRGWDAYTSGEYQYEFLTGGILIIVMAVIIVSSAHPIRRLMRRYWLWSHHLLPIAAIVLAVMHGAAVVLIGFAVYLADRLFGYIYLAQVRYREMGSAGKAKLLPSGLIRITFPRTLHFQPGQYMCLQIPKVSIFEYHTFSIASTPSDDTLSFLIKQDGSWTRSLAKKISALSENDQELPLRAFLHGPIGSIGLDWQSNRYEAFVLVAGGIGITPLMNLYRHLACQCRRGRPLKRVLLLWTVRQTQTVTDCVETALSARGDDEAMDDLDLTEKGIVSQNEFETHLFVTKDAPPGVQFPSVAESSSAEAQLLGHVVWNQGRPDLKKQFAEVSSQASRDGVGRVGVLACGPGALTADVCNRAGSASSSKVRFDVHLEHFY